MLNENLRFLDDLVFEISSKSARTIRKNWSVFRLRSTLERRIIDRKAIVRTITKKIFPGYLKSTASSRYMRKIEANYREDLPNELKVHIVEHLKEDEDKELDYLPTERDLIQRDIVPKAL